MKSIGLVLVAGGSGLRMGNNLPKQFISIGSKTILQHCIDRFLKWNSSLSIVLVLPKNQIEYWTSISGPVEELPYQICEGGKERFYSVKNGLEKLGDVDFVMIHDGVRPFVSLQTLERLKDTMENHEGVIPVITPNESIRLINKTHSESLDRDKIRLVQTPQCFNYSKLKDAYQVPYQSSFTDDASVFENAGHAVHLVEGNKENIKITQPEDLAWAKVYLQSEL